MAILQPTITNISLDTPQPIVGSVIVSSNVTNTTFYSSKILNFIEPIEINGILKTVFYTEVNTNVNIGDRVYILNGSYDSNQNIGRNKYARFSDGYRVLAVEGCRVALDIDYVGTLPYKDFTTKDFIYIHHIQTQNEFDYINSLKIPINGELPLKSIFSGNIGDNGTLLIGSQNIIYVSTPFVGSDDPQTKNVGIPSQDFTPGFYVRVDDQIKNEWINVTQQFVSNNITQNSNFSLSGNIFVVGENFIYDGQEFLESGIYRYNNFGWEFDTLYYQAYLSKVNFRSGTFRGTFNDGVFGTYLKRNVWSRSEWNSGVFVNSVWKDGTMNSKHKIDELSYNCVVKIVGSISQVLQSIDLTNNKGFGYNFIEDSTFETFIINNGSFKNCNLISSDPNNNAIDNYYNSTNKFTNLINGGRFEMCDISQVNSSGGYFLNSSVVNSNLLRSRLVSSESADTTLDGGFWSSEGGVKIVGADIWSYDENQNTILGSTQSIIKGTLKLFISETDYFKLSQGDTFFISKISKDKIINLLTDDQKIYFPLENKFIIDNYFDYTLDKNTKRNLQVSLKSSNDNKFKTYVVPSPTVVPNYVDVLDGDNLEFWYKLPPYTNNETVPSYRGQYDITYDDSVGYYLGDFVFDKDTINPNIFNFYLYWPIDRLNSSGRARNINEAKDFANRGQGIEVDANGFTDWIFVGTYSGVWASSSSYVGNYVEEVQPPNYSPRYATGSVIGTDQDIINSDNFWIFVGTGDGIVPITNKSRQVLVSVDYLSANFVTSSNYNLPSIDITSELFGWYYDQNGTDIYTRSYIFNPITIHNVNDVLSNNVLGNGDFKSGVAINSTWQSGDNTNYDNAEIIPTNFTQLGGRSVPNNYTIFLDTVQGGRRILRIPTNGKKYSTYDFDGYDFKPGDFVWVNALDYVVNNNIYNVDGRYRVNKILSNEISLISNEINDPLSGLNTGGVFRTPIARFNRYFSINKFFVKNTKVISGKFTKTLFEDCLFENDFFEKYVYPSRNITNTERIRLVNILFNRNNNTIKSGIVYKSHFVDGVFDGATFYDSFWLGNNFTDGLFKYSVWTNGNFNGGKFVDSKDPKFFTFDYDYSSNTRLWQDGSFNNGEFFNSLWVRGIFNNGKFYKSDWTGGTWNNGILGSINLKSNETTLSFYGPTTSFGATFTVWNNGVVENAIVGGDGYLDWYNGKMLGGLFTSNGRGRNVQSVWHNGEFYGSSFTKQAWWKNGKFFSGKFQSEIGWTAVSFTTFSNDSYNYGWVNGEFYAGEFGLGTASGPNSTWFNGTFYDGTFVGKFWRNGLFIDGNFNGNFVNKGEVSENLLNYRDNFYGMWQNGQVNDTLYDVKKDIIVADTRTLRPRSRTGRLNLGPSFNGVIWRNGTFSHFDGVMNNSVWLNGNFNKGSFNNSIFNPFVDLGLVGFSLSDYNRLKYFQQMVDDISSIPQSGDGTLYLNFVLDVIESYDGESDYDLELVVDFYFENNLDPINDYKSVNYEKVIGDAFPADINSTTIMRVREQRLFSKDDDQFLAIKIVNNNGVFNYNTFSPPINTQQVPLKFEERDTCIWTDGNFNNSEFYYSKWISGNFNDGTMSGGIWLGGVFNYGSMYNCYWENGIWRNGNWYGTPFDYKSLSDDGQSFTISDKRTNDILTNVYNYTNIPHIFLSNIVVLLDNESSVHNFDPTLGYVSWTFSTQE
jgi:hypothetical protein